VRITNRKTFSRLSDFTEHIRTTILDAKECNIPDTGDCKDKIVRFTFDGVKHAKCVSISANFKFTNLTKDDFANIIDIIGEEINFILGHK
jgi:hypothetical protein